MTARETVHTHGCLNCRPDMVPDFTRDDPRFHAYSSPKKCQSSFQVLVDGAPVSYTRGAFEGLEGWALFTGATTDAVHPCPCGSAEICVEPRFGRVEIHHEGAC